MNKANHPFLVRRTCTRKHGEPDELGSHPLETYRNLDAYVLLGDPGAGKTESFKLEAEESGGKYIKARDFATFDPGEKYQDKTLFIDALDEMRTDGGDGRTPLDHIRKHLERIGRPRFRLSCREADWLGDSDNLALSSVSPDDKIVALHLDPLTNKEVVDILRHEATILDPADFTRKAGEHRLSELLRNPQTLNLLVEAVGGNEWPQSRMEIYKVACSKLVSENNSEHRRAKRDKSLPADTLLNAAGYLCAVHLLSGIAGFALDEDATDNQHFNWKELAAPDMPLLAALKTNLFQRDGEEQRNPVHRSVAEYLGAHYLANLVEKHGLPFGRILALITGVDGGVVPDLRGLAAWLSVHCRLGRPLLIERDPLGVVLYGDVRNFPADDKQLVLSALNNEAHRYPWFRSDDWSSSPFGALCTIDMEPSFREILTSPSREEADQVLLECVLDAMRYGEPMAMLGDQLEAVIRDARYRSAIRESAALALYHVMPDDGSRLLKVAEDINADKVEDRDDEILAFLLRKLYPRYILPEQILDYLHLPKARNLIGGYFSFWSRELSDLTIRDDLPLLLDQLVQRHTALRKVSFENRINRMVGELLARGLEAYGDSITDNLLYDWLGVGLDEYEHNLLEKEHVERIASWFTDRPNRYKAMVEYAASLSVNQENVRLCMYQCETRLHGAPPPADIGQWYLERAITEQQSKLAEYFFSEAVFMLKKQGGQQDLTQPALEYLEYLTSSNPLLQQWLEPFISCPIGEWQQEQALQQLKWKSEHQKRKSEWVSFFRKNIVAIRDGNAHPKILHDLALAYSGLAHEAQGETPDKRLNDFLDGDKELIEAAHAGFRHALDRNDLPTVSEIVKLELKGKMHYIRPACLVAMDELYQIDPASALKLDEKVLSKVLAFRFSFNVGDDPAWVVTLVQARPYLVAEVLLAYALPMLRAGKEHISGLSLLAYNEAYAAVARIAIAQLLEGFPLRARKRQLENALTHLLKGALDHLDKKVLLSIVERKLQLGSLDASQRVYWLACGLIINPEAYMITLHQYIGKNKIRRCHLAVFLHDRWERGSPYVALPETALGLLIELLAPDCSPERPEGAHWVGPAMHTADLVRSFISTLGGNPAKTASSELERLLILPDIKNWHNVLRGAIHTQRIANRKALFHRLSVEQVCHTLANLKPASASDLAALTFDHLRDIARKIRDSSTNDYKQYWSYDQSNKTLNKHKPENDCRDTLLSDLNERLGKLGINAEREGNYADNKRADIKVSYGGANGFNVPIEIKKDSHADLWRAIHEQLIPKYVRDPGADGYGIFLVFWFGGKGMTPPPDGKKLRSAEELENRLRQTLSPEERHHIQVCVIDCALPS